MNKIDKIYKKWNISKTDISVGKLLSAALLFYFIENKQYRCYFKWQILEFNDHSVMIYLIKFFRSIGNEGIKQSKILIEYFLENGYFNRPGSLDFLLSAKGKEFLKDFVDANLIVSSDIETRFAKKLLFGKNVFNIFDEAK